MALKPYTLRLDEEEYEKLKNQLNQFGDPDINVAYVLRSYIRDLNRALPILVSSGWDLKNYFGLFGSWLKQISTMTQMDSFAKTALNPWAFWLPPQPDTPKRPATGTNANAGQDEPASGTPFEKPTTGSP